MEHEELHKVTQWLGQVKDKGKELQALYCPFCNGGKHKDKHTFSINKETKKSTQRNFCLNHSSKGKLLSCYIKKSGFKEYKIRCLKFKS